MSEVASQAHLKSLTGTSQPEAQKQVLERLGITAFVGSNGRLVVYKEVLYRAQLAEKPDTVELSLDG